MSVENTNSRNRRVLYDTDTDCFYLESRSEAANRCRLERERHTSTLNRGEDRHLQIRHQQTEYARYMYRRKVASEIEATRESLRDNVAYKKVLDRIEANKHQHHHERQHQQAFLAGILPETADLGVHPRGRSSSEIHGPHVTYFQLLPEIEHEKKEMDHIFLRKKKCSQLLKRRRQMQVIDRRLDTITLLRGTREYIGDGSAAGVVDGRAGSASSEYEGAAFRRPRLVLPAIRATKESTRGHRSICETDM